MVRKIIQIAQEACNGCGLCAEACHEGAIQMREGKAWLVREDYCDGLGDCLPACPTGAITWEEREAAAYDPAAVLAAQGRKAPPILPCGCPGTQMQEIAREETEVAPAAAATPSQLRQWPVQIKLVPIRAPFFDGAHLLVAADCTAFAYGDFHREFIRGHITLVGCPKLDGEDYTPKLTQILARNAIKSVTVARMEVPCCGGLEQAVKGALVASGAAIPWRVVTISTQGMLLQERIGG